MLPRLVRALPLLIVGTVFLATCAARLVVHYCGPEAPDWDPDSHGWPGRFLGEGASFLHRLELITFDTRVAAAADSARTATNIGLVVLGDADRQAIQAKDGSFYPLVRHVYAALLEELADQGAMGVVLDVFLLQPWPGIADPTSPTNARISADERLALALRGKARMSVTTIALHDAGADAIRLPYLAFATNASAVGHATWMRDVDTVVRRAEAFVEAPPALSGPRNRQGRVWHAGILLAAKAAGLDLANASIGPGSIAIPRRRGAVGETVFLPVNEFGELLIDWALPTGHPRLRQENATNLLAAHAARRAGEPVTPQWSNQLVVVAVDLPGAVDRGSTPLGRDEMEASGIWNVANMILTEQLPRPVGLRVEFGLIALLTGAAALINWRLRALWSTALVSGLAVGYIGCAFLAYEGSRVLLPVVLPVIGAIAMTHVAMVTCRLAAELIERGRVRGFWRRLLSRSVFKQLETVAFQLRGGRHRHATVVFADLRGFVGILGRARAEPNGGVDRGEADRALVVVNGYLTGIATTFREHHGTLDKFIGDCVMAFWGAPVPDERHAARAVEAAIAAQRLVQRLNRSSPPRDDGDADWWQRQGTAGGTPWSQPLRFGIGINTGLVVAGFVGSGDTMSNYTVLGADVNLASRLEDEAGGDEILISASTFAELERTAPDLASRCESRGRQTLRGMSERVSVYAVRWRDEEVPGAVPVPPAP